MAAFGQKQEALEAYRAEQIRHLQELEKSIQDQKTQSIAEQVRHLQEMGYKPEHLLNADGIVIVNIYEMEADTFLNGYNAKKRQAEE